MTATTEKVPITTTLSANSRFLLRALFALLLTYILVWVGYKSVRIGTAGYGLWQIQETVREMAAAGPSGIDADELEQMLMNTRRYVLIIDDETAIFMPMLSRMGWVPEVGPLLQDAPALMDMAVAGLDSAAYAYRGLKPAVHLLQDDSLSTTDLLSAGLETISTAQSDLAAAGESFDLLVGAYGRLQHTTAYPQPLPDLLNQIEPLLPLADDLFEIMPVLPQILGQEGPQRYLLIAQNEDELRATGGFISGAGLLVIEEGQIVSLAFGDAYGVDDLAGKLYEEYPPQTLYDFMQLDYFLFRDANYWPDFPTSAEKAIALYEYGQGSPPLDGAVAIDQRFLELLLSGMGPLTLPSGEKITSENLIEQLRASWGAGAGEDRDWIRNRKSFLGEFSAALRQRLESGDISGIDPLQLANGMHTALNGKHIQIYMRSPEAAARLDTVGWDGRLPITPAADYLYVLDTNFGFNKSNAVVERTTHYNVNLHSDGRGVADLTLDYTHNAPAATTDCSQRISYFEITAYSDIVNLCFFNFLRVYTPADAYLLAANEHQIPGESMLRELDWRSTAFAINEFAEFSTFSNYFVLAPGNELRSYMSYQLPRVVTGQEAQKQYALTIPKQAGVWEQPLIITINLPENAVFEGASIEPTGVAGSLVRFDLRQQADIYLIVDFRQPASAPVTGN